MLLSRFPRVSLAHLPTPLELLPRLSRHLGGPDIYVKRDDCTGLATGGNKTRKLEFLMGEAIRQKASVVITQGAVQSNHARQTAAAACRAGLKCELVFEQRVVDASETYRHSGNVLLDRIFGAHIREVDKGSDMDAAMEEVAAELRAKGERPYLIPGGGSNAIGALGYVACAMELVAQANERQLPVDHIVHATGSAGTQAGLAVGLRACGDAIPLLGIGVSAAQSEQEHKVYTLACATAEYVGATGAVGRKDIVANCDYIGDGYGLPTRAMNNAVLLLARTEGILLDPVYTGKGMAGLIDLVKRGYFAKAKNIVFIHTGGSPGLFAYRDQLSLGA